MLIHNIYIYYHSPLYHLPNANYKRVVKIRNSDEKACHVIIYTGKYQRFKMGAYLCSKIKIARMLRWGSCMKLWELGERRTYLVFLRGFRASKDKIVWLSERQEDRDMAYLWFLWSSRVPYQDTATGWVLAKEVVPGAADVGLMSVNFDVKFL